MSAEDKARPEGGGTKDTFHTRANDFNYNVAYAGLWLSNSRSYRGTFTRVAARTMSRPPSIRVRFIPRFVSLQLLAPRYDDHRLEPRRISDGTVPACQQRRSPESRAHHFISMINTLHFMRIILRPLQWSERVREVYPNPRFTATHPIFLAFLTPETTHTWNAVVSHRARRSQPNDPLPPSSSSSSPPLVPAATISSACSSNPFLSCSLARVRPSVRPPPPRTQPIFFNVRQL